MVGLSAVGVGLGLIEVSVWTGTQEVVPEHSIGPAYAFLSVAMSTVLLVVPFGAGWLRDHFGTYDYGSFVCSGSSLIGMACAVALYFLEPKLRNPSQVYRKFYVVRIAMTKKAKTMRKVGKRHSITVGEVPYLREFIEKGQRVEDLLSDTTQTEPKLVGAMQEYTTGGDRVITGGVGGGGPTGLSTSLPSDFWSTMVTKDVQVTEIHPSR